MTDMIKLLMVDNSYADRKLFQMLLCGGDPPWLRNVEMVSIDKPYEDVSEYASFDGVILDYRLSRGENGVDVARAIHEYNWRIPILMMTGVPDQLPQNVLTFVDRVAAKDVTLTDGFNPVDPLLVVRAWLRDIGRAVQAGKRP